MARAVNPIHRTVSEGIEGEMRSYGLTAETELRGLQHEPFHEPGVYPQQVDGRDVARGAIAGAVAGLIAGWVMVKFQEGWAKIAEGRVESRNLRQSVPEHRAKRDFDSSNRDEQEASGAEDETPDDATVHTAELISEKVFDHKLTRDEKKVAGPAVHYAFSVGVGALYGAASGVLPA